MGRIKDLQGQTVMSFDQPCHLPCESGEVKRRGVQTQDSQKQMEGKHELCDTGSLSPLYERVFSDSNSGFRPNRSAHQALKQESAYAAEDCSTEVDLEKFFDKVNHTRLMAPRERVFCQG